MAIVPEVNFGDMVITDHFVILNNRRLLSGFKVQARFKQVIEGHIKICSIKDSSIKAIPVQQKEKIDTNTYKFLATVNTNQYKKTLTEIVKLSGLSAGTGSRLIKQCVKNGYIKLVQISWGRGRPRYPILTAKGNQYLGIKEEKAPYGKGAGDEHLIAQIQIKNHFSKFNPTLELNRMNKFIDVGILLNNKDKLIAIEVEMSSVNVAQEGHLKDFQNIIIKGFNKILMIKGF